MFVIEKSNRVPRARRNASVKLPFDKLLEKGDSFFVPSTEVRTGTVKVQALRYKSKHALHISVYLEGSGCRVVRN